VQAKIPPTLANHLLPKGIDGDDRGTRWSIDTGCRLASHGWVTTNSPGWSMGLRLDYNEKRVIDLLRTQGPQSRSRLVHSAQITAPTLTRVTQNLLDHGLLKEAHKLHDGHRGKPAQVLALNPDGAYSVGIAVQSEFVSVCLIDLTGNLRGEAVRNIDVPQPEPVAKLCEQMLARLVGEAGISRRRIVGAGVCMPGTAVSATSEAKRAGIPGFLPVEFAAWRGVAFDSLFRKALGLPTWFENSAKASTLADAYFGAGQTLAHFGVIHIAYGLGGGIMLNRQLYRGVLGRAAEFGSLFPYEGIRPSGRDLLLFLAQHMQAPPRHLRELRDAALPADLIEAWVERVMPGLSVMCQHFAVTLDLPVLILNGLLPSSVLNPLSRSLHEHLARLIDSSLTVPEIHVSRLAGGGLGIGAASLPLYFVTAPELD
jgi:predicted NBD/HSP70 family sugar kinase